MTMIRTLAAALFAVAVSSCATAPEEKPTGNDAEVVTRVEYLPGRIVTVPYPVPDSSLTPDVEPLTEEHISGVDIPPEDAMQSAVAWARQYHNLATTYDVLRGWIIGVRAGQQVDQDTGEPDGTND